METRRLPMTAGEIRASYEQAADRKKQIGILADLNLCTNREIIDVLCEEGVYDGRRGNRKSPQPAQESRQEGDKKEIVASDQPDATEAAATHELRQEGGKTACGMSLAALVTMLRRVEEAFPDTRVIVSGTRSVGGATLLVNYGSDGEVIDTTLLLQEI